MMDVRTFSSSVAGGSRGICAVLTRLDQVPGGFRVGLVGIASAVRLGPSGFADDVTPSCLDYLYHQEWIKLMWAVALALIAALAKVRSWYAGNLD